MSHAQSVLPEFAYETSITRRVLERIPDDRLDWKAHPKSHTIGWVGAHLAEIVGWPVGTLTATEWDINPVGGTRYQTPDLKSRQEILEFFDQNVAESTKTIEATPDDDFLTNWSLLDGGQTLLTLPRRDVLRTWVLNHMVHHRAILCVYLRLNDIPVPGVYGPSGDE